MSFVGPLYRVSSQFLKPLKKKHAHFSTDLPVFPGVTLPTVTLLVNALAHATSGRLVIESISNIGPHYARTLREWRRRFEDHFGDVERALRKNYPSVFDDDHSGQGGEQLAIFRRRWICKTSHCHRFSCLLNFGGFFFLLPIYLISVDTDYL
jgi:hypothetical protein